ncbi:MAG: 2-oxo acid dehydrogenase subunit E2, partial [Acidimicrobiia bacterium]|nr:2-oxo acid dehydrogenase subunit E2 [Acidimicrobiia bacterium]
RRARDAGVDLRQVRAAGHATGPAGRITHEDLDRYLTGGLRGAGPGGVAAPTGAPGLAREARSGSTRQPMVGLRRRIAHRMVTSATTIPHITYVEEVDVTALEDLRTTLNDRGADNPNQPRLTVLPFLVRALTNILADFPIFNAHLEEAGAGGPVGDAGPTEATGTDTLTVYDGIHVGIATQTDNGLIVPVLRHAEAHTIWSAASAIAELSEGTRSGTAPADALSGSTITITSLGALGGIVSTPIINKPEVAIVGVNKIAIRPVWDDGEFVPRKIMNLSCSFDHRVIDGWDAANFVQAIRIQLERPALLFIDELGPGPPEAGS